ncbi:hypothetical protein GCM10007304_14370 [Rhodococcoides trifolii]|uniref:Uncharacterized protein n=1 Tax=Rhodococcoides trifolii TaxID=908250 RepID=A0A917CXV9_9NOCA|nr:hypothetical protein [Rhodococcus trifolii]GGG01502.1 hypothetical protein GCM10007304_14370 [Rhodococcus trifolii]
MQILVSFAPWIVYAILESTVSWTLSLAGALAVTLAVLAYKYRSAQPVDFLSIGGVVFFVVMLAASPLLGQGTVEAYTQTLSHGWIALLMWGSIAARTPFTEVFARGEAPAEMIDTPEFLRFNCIISAMWAASFTVGTAVLVVLQWNGVDSGTFVVIAASIAVPIVAMKRYIDSVTADDEMQEAVSA